MAPQAFAASLDTWKRSHLSQEDQLRFARVHGASERHRCKRICCRAARVQVPALDRPLSVEHRLCRPARQPGYLKVPFRSPNDMFHAPHLFIARGFDFKLCPYNHAHLATGIPNRAKLEIVPEHAAALFVILYGAAVLHLGQYRLSIAKLQSVTPTMATSNQANACLISWTVLKSVSAPCINRQLRPRHSSTP